MATKSSVVAHHGLALMLCENATVLKETLVGLDVSGLDIQRVGDRAIVMPVYLLETVRRALEERGVYPHVVGPYVVEAEDDEEEEVEAQGDGADGDEEEGA